MASVKLKANALDERVLNEVVSRGTYGLSYARLRIQEKIQVAKSVKAVVNHLKMSSDND